MQKKDKWGELEQILKMISTNIRDKSEDKDHEKMTCYESILNCFGSFFGTLRAWMPCCCFCCPYPYYQIT